ncbi:MAG: GatB/YqeY domain-containing protein, partial [Polyangiaceae bacterium]
RTGDPMSDAAVEKILRKLLKSNLETMKSTEDEEQRATIAQENEVLESLLPKQLSEDEIVQALAPVADAIKAAPSDGPATGIAMKHLKKSGAAVDGKTVSSAVKKLRA